MAQNPPNAFPHLQKNILDTLSKVFFSRNLDQPECGAETRVEGETTSTMREVEFSHLPMSWSSRRRKAAPKIRLNEFMNIVLTCQKCS